MSLKLINKLMPNSFTFFIGLRYLKSKKNKRLPSLTTVLSSVGIILGVATLIVVMSVMNGFRVNLMEKIIGFNAHIGVYPMSGAKISNYEVVVNEIKQNKNVTSVIPIEEHQGMMINKKNKASAGAILRGISYSDFVAKSASFDDVNGELNKFKVGAGEGAVNGISASGNGTGTAGTGDEMGDSNTVFLGSELAARLGVKIGSKVAFLSPNANKTIAGFIPKIKTYTVGGIVNVGLQQYDGVMAFVPLSSAQALSGDQPSAENGNSGSVTSIEVLVKNPMYVGNVVQSLRKLKTLKHFALIDWQHENQGLMEAIKVESVVMFFILSLFVVVATFAVFSSLTMLVTEKSKNIAILRSMGVSKFQIAQIFFITGFVISVIGTLLGSALGLLFASNVENIRQAIEFAFGVNLFNSAIYFLSHLPTQIMPLDVIVICIMSLCFGVVASIVPAIKASKYKPADALKYF